MIETLATALIVAFLLPLLGCFLLRKKNKKMEKEVNSANVEKIRAIKEMNIAQSERKESRKKAVIMFFFLLRRGGITPESDGENLDKVSARLQSRQEKMNEARIICSLSDLTVSLLPEFEEIVKELRFMKSNDSKNPYAVNIWLAGDKNDLFKSLDLLGIRTLEDIESLYEWTQEKYPDQSEIKKE